MKKILILWILSLVVAHAQIRIGVINEDTTTRPLPYFGALAWKNSNLYVVKPTGNAVKLLQNDSRLFVGDNNRVGVGTKTPSQAFEVAGNAKIGGSLQIGVGAGILRSDANGLLSASTLIVGDIPYLGSLYLPLAGGGDITGNVSISDGDFRLFSQTDAFGEKARFRIQNTGSGSTDTFLEVFQDKYFSWAGWVPGGSVFTLKNGFLGLGGQTNPQATLDLGTSGTFRWGNAAGTDKFLRSINNNGDAAWTTITKSTVGLGNVDNTSDVNKPISSAVSTELLKYAKLAASAQEFTGFNLFSGASIHSGVRKLSNSQSSYGTGKVITSLADGSEVWTRIKRTNNLSYSNGAFFWGENDGQDSTSWAANLNSRFLQISNAASTYASLSGDNNFLGTNTFLTPVFANSTSTSSFSSITGVWSNTGNLGVFSFRYNTKVGPSTVTWNPLRLDANGWVGIGMDPSQAFEVLGAAKFNSAITATSISASGTVSGNSISTKKLIGSSATPTINFGTVSGDDLGGSITYTPGTDIGGTITTVSFNSAYSTAPFVYLQDVNDNYVSGNTNAVRVSSTTSGFSLTVKTGLALHAGQTYKWNYIVKQ